MSNEFKLVPADPTAAMVNAALISDGIVPRYYAMLAAAPQPPALGGEPEVVGMVYGQRVIRLTDYRAHVATLQAENKRLDLMVAQADHNYDADRAEWNRERDQFRAQRDELHRMLGLAWGDGDVSAEDCRKIDAALSRPAGSEQV